MKNIFRRKEKGFTIVEIVVAVSVFSILVMIVFGLIVAAIREQRRHYASQDAFGQLGYALEYMSRTLRMGQKDLTGVCIGAKENYELTHVDKGVKFINFEGECHEFFWDTASGRLKEVRAGEVGFITSDTIDVLNFTVKLQNQSQSADSKQPFVTLLVKVKGKGGEVEERFEATIQTSLSQRNLDIRK
ncbi:MAG: prepilin-type N-terminal cleavage/methylation domain-containing protein [Candidatus Wildermuthbacteria bacterium]|nr:prepilin-type N-terminal cleavage/methylation domain-containing protein [Candidatus Wildermuthbacteria bacterium]